MKKQFLLFPLLFALASTAPAASVLQNFNDIGDVTLTNGMPLRDLDVTGGLGFTTGYEQTGSGVPVTRTNDLKVTLANYISGQDGGTQHWSVAAVTSSSGAARRTQTRSTPAMSGTIWFSFLASLQTTNGDVALTFNGAWNGSGQPTVNNPGLRVGLGSSTVAGARGALGVGPLTSATAEQNLSSITNGVNGAITAANFVPTDGTPGLVLGRIDSEPSTGFPRVSVWYNPNVANAASLPAPTVTFVDAEFAYVPTTVTRIGYQVNRSPAPATQNEIIDNVKVSDEPTGFDIVYKNAALPTPVVSVIGIVPVGNESGPTNVTFMVITDKPVATALTVSYTLGGVATNGFDGAGTFVDADYTDPHFNAGTLSGSVVIPAGKSNATVVLTVVDDALPEGNESITIAIPTSSEYILSGGSATGSILDNNDANVSLQYMFTRTVVPQVFDTNLVAAPATVTGIGNGSYSGVYNISPDAAYSAGGDSTAADAATAIANGDYMGIAVSPVLGRSLTLTNLQFQAVYGNYLFQVPEAASAVIFIRSSVDNFTANLAEFTLLPDNVVFPDIWYSNYVALGNEFRDLPGQVEFRLYIYDDSNHNQVGVRIDNLYINGVTGSLPAGVNQISVSTNLLHAAEPASAGQFTLTRVGDLAGSLTVNYTMSGTAANGVDYLQLPGSATFAAGVGEVVVTVTPLDDDFPEPVETVILSLTTGTGYGILAPSSATMNLADDADIGGLVAYFFNENNNSAPSLAAGAVAGVKLTNLVVALNASAGPGLGAFGQNGGAGVGHGYANSVWYSAPSTFYYRGEYWGTDAEQALAGGDYLSLTIGAMPGNALHLTNLSARVKMSPTGGQSATVFVRSSLDNFATDLATTVVVGDDVAANPFLLWNAPLALSDIVGAVEFRLYAYGTRISGNDILRLDDITFSGTVGNLPAGTQVVAVAASDASAGEPGSDTGSFTITRFGNIAGPLTLTYALSGTASNGVDYSTLGTSANFAAGQASLVITVTPLDDNRPEPNETVTLSILTNAAYALGFYTTATVNLADDADQTPLFTFAASDTNAYERLSSLAGSFTLARTLGEMASSMTINFTLGGNAVLGVDYVSSATNSVTFGAGVTSHVIQIVPINNALLDGDRTVTLSIQTTPSFILDPPTTRTVTIVDDELAAGTVLWTDNFDAGTSAANFTVTSASDLGIDDYEVNFAFDYSSIGLPPAPGSSTTVGLMINANASGAPAGVNFYPVGQSFSGDFALRFNLYVSMDPLAGAENEAAYFGINQTGLATNWISAFGGVYTNYGEGIWATVATRDGTPGIATLLAATNLGTAPILAGNAGNLPDLFNSPPYAMLGRPNNAYDSTNKTWVDCELSQLGGVTTLKLNNSPVLQYTNGPAAASGNVFLGFGDPFATLGSANCFAVFDNVRVVRLVAPAAQPRITGISASGNNVEITFAAGAADAAASFKLQSSVSVSEGYADDNTATIIALGPGQFKATTAKSGTARFYRIRR
jgi:hypothetical protein